jgi:hypothetical protein
LGKRRGQSRSARIAGRSASQNAERERERDEIGLGRFSLDAPLAAQIPIKTVRVGRVFELQAEVEEEFYGGFRPSDPGPGGGSDTKDRRKGASSYNRVWGRGDITVERFGRKVAWQRTPRRWAAERVTNGPWPFILRREWEAYGKELARRRGDPDEARDRAEHQVALEDYEWLLGQEHGAPRRTPPPRFPKLPGRLLSAPAYGRGVRRWIEREKLAQHSERRVQRYLATWYKPSRAVEEQRFKRLKRLRIEIKLVPKYKYDLRYETQVVADYLAAGGEIDPCPAETTTKMLETRKVGRPPLGERAMKTNAEKAARKRHLRHERRKHRDKKRRQRERLRVITATAAPSPGKTSNDRTVESHGCHVNPKGVGGGNGAKSPRP